MPWKPYESLSQRKAKPRTRTMRTAGTKSQIREVKLKNLEKARKAKKKIALAKKKKAKAT